MTGYRSPDLRHNCDRDGCYIESLPDWGDINAAFPRKIRPTDIDGMVEMSGHFLFLEQKGLGAGFESEGQRKALKELSNDHRTTVACVRPTTDDEDPDRYEMLVFRGGEAVTNGWSPITKADLIEWLKDWARQADLKPAANLRMKVRDLESRVADLDAQNHALELEYLALAKKQRKDPA